MINTYINKKLIRNISRQMRVICPDALDETIAVPDELILHSELF